jgi:uncharacterized repeat protein (TIGR01451 family)
VTATGGGAGGRLTVFNRSQWAGDYVGAGVTFIEMDLKNLGSVPLSIRIGLKSGTANGSPGYVSTTPFALPADNAWHHAVFGLDAGSLTPIGSPAALNTFLSSVAELRIVHAPTPSLTGIFITSQLGIDNITAGATPVSPLFSKSFASPAVAIGGSLALSFTITNPSTFPVSGIGFTDTLPTGLTGTSAVTGTCGGGAIGTSPTSISLAGATLAGGGSCTFSVLLTAAVPGIQNNSASVVYSCGAPAPCTGNAAAASTTVTALPPTLTKSFGAATVDQGGLTSLAFTLTNPNAVSMSGIAFTDTLPAGLAVLSGGLATNCGAGVILGVIGTNTITVSNVTLAALSTCTVTLTNVSALAVGTQLNSTSTITGNIGGVALAGAPAVASVVVSPPSDAFQVRYLTLQYGDGVVNFTNAGALAGTDPAGTICVNVYAFDPAEEMISCCACKVTPNGLASISARTDIMGNTLTPGTPQSITIKLLATAAGGGACNAGTQPTATNLARGMKAWAATLHSLTIQAARLRRR